MSADSLMDTAAVFMERKTQTHHAARPSEARARGPLRRLFPLIGTSMSGRLRKERGPWDVGRLTVVAG
jgi:hypothetical protein